MTGWKTWLAAICTAGLGVVSSMHGEIETGSRQIAAGIALVGIDHKLDKSRGTLRGVRACPRQ